MSDRKQTGVTGSGRNVANYNARLPTKWTTILIVIVLGVIAIALVWHRWRYPFGRSHSCENILSFALRAYAESQFGWFPAGEQTPEASLTLLSRTDSSINVEILRGKTVAWRVVDDILRSGGLLGPDTCGWHYVQGLTLSDDPRLALFWDKFGLGHHGERLPGGGHVVWFVNGTREYIDETNWRQFLVLQQRLHASRDDRARKGIPILTAKVRLPSGEIVEKFDGHFRLTVRKGRASITRDGRRLEASALRWYRFDFGTSLSDESGSRKVNGEEEVVSLTLFLEGMESLPVQVWADYYPQVGFWVGDGACLGKGGR